MLLNALLLSGFTKGRIFFDTFIGILFWLGFWLKFTLRAAFLNGVFNEAVGNFVYSGPACDLALNVASCGIFGLLVARVLREKYFFSYANMKDEVKFKALFAFYQKYRKPVLIAFAVLFVAVAISNTYFGIYQKGSIPKVKLPLGLGGVYTWLLLFGLASFSAVLLDFEFRLNKRPYAVIGLCLLEGLFSNVSLLSRGMIVNVTSLMIGTTAHLKRRFVETDLKLKFAFLVMFGTLFLGSVFAVNFIRSSKFTVLANKIGGTSFYSSGNRAMVQTRLNITKGSTKEVFIDRFVGMEGVMAVSSYPHLGWDLWTTAWEEKYADSGTSFYDNNLIVSPYINTDFTKHHFISLPGVVAFFFYPGSFLFLFGSMFVLGLLAAGVEYSIYKLGGANIILCALLGQVIAYRFAHYGYVPRQTYLLFGTIYLNLLILYGLNKIVAIASPSR